MSGLLAVVVFLAIVSLYCLPIIVAAVRKVPHLGSVTVVDLFLGWTVIGWIVALAMACRSRNDLSPGS
jgi:hypothetical protein